MTPSAPTNKELAERLLTMVYGPWTFIEGQQESMLLISKEEAKLIHHAAARLSESGGEVHSDHPLRHYDRTCPACNPLSEAREVAKSIRKFKRADGHWPSWNRGTIEKALALLTKTATLIERLSRQRDDACYLAQSAAERIERCKAPPQRRRS